MALRPLTSRRTTRRVVLAFAVVVALDAMTVSSHHDDRGPLPAPRTTVDLNTIGEVAPLLAEPSVVHAATEISDIAASTSASDPQTADQIADPIAGRAMSGEHAIYMAMAVIEVTFVYPSPSGPPRLTPSQVVMFRDAVARHVAHHDERVRLRQLGAAEDTLAILKAQAHDDLDTSAKRILNQDQYAKYEDIRGYFDIENVVPFTTGRTGRVAERLAEQ